MAERSLPARTVELAPTPGAEGDPALPAAAPDVTETVPDVEEVSYPDWGPPAVTDGLSVTDLELARIAGKSEVGPSAQQPQVERLEDLLRSHAIGGSNRNSEGYFGPKTTELVITAYRELLDQDSVGVVGRDLLDELHRRYDVPVVA